MSAPGIECDNRRRVGLVQMFRLSGTTIAEWANAGSRCGRFRIAWGPVLTETECDTLRSKLVSAPRDPVEWIHVPIRERVPASSRIGALPPMLRRVIDDIESIAGGLRLSEPPRHNKYLSGGACTPHADSYSLAPVGRTVTVNILLGPAFEGGQFRIMGEPYRDFRIGDAIIFPSIARHSVDEITAGERHTITAWLA